MHCNHEYLNVYFVGISSKNPVVKMIIDKGKNNKFNLAFLLFALKCMLQNNAEA